MHTALCDKYTSSPYPPPQQLIWMQVSQEGAAYFPPVDINSVHPILIITNKAPNDDDSGIIISPSIPWS